MTNLRKSALAVAVLAGLALSSVASAYTVTNNSTGFTTEGIAYFDVPASATTPIGIYTPTAVTFQSTDNIIGRTTGFALRVTLNNGAQFVAPPAVAFSDPTWTVASSVSGNVLIVTFQNSGSPHPIAAGMSLTIGAAGSPTDELTPTTAGVLQLSSLTALASSGQQVSGSFQFFDPVTTQPILGSQSQVFLQSGNPVTTSALSSGTSAKIDVGATPSQTLFSPCGALGGSAFCSDPTATSTSHTFDSGNVTASVIASPTLNFGYFTFNTGDVLTTTLTGNLAAFVQSGGAVDMVSGNNCGGTVLATGVVNSGATSATFTNTLTASSPGPIGPNEICLTVPGGNTMPIPGTTLTASTSFQRGTATAVAGTTQPLATIAPNGPVVHVYTFNPAGNSTQQSFLRISDTGPAGGQVTITGIDDAGNPGAGAVTLMLAAGQSVQLNSSCLQSGTSCPTGVPVTGALGTGTGKWRLTVVSYFPNLVVTSLNRNNNTGTVTNLTNYDVNGKQNLWGYAGDNGN
jgi:hypothetical protein